MRYRVLLAGIAFIFSNLLSFGQQNHAISSKPNVLFIMVDDLRPELGSYGKDHIVSPNIDRLAKRGQLFTQAYVNYPVCGPSRASLLSGLYTSRSRWKSWNTSQDREVPGLVSLPMHFKNNHYKTASLGKVYNNFEDGTGSWDEIWRPPNTTTPWDYQTEKNIKIFEDRNRVRSENLETRNNHNLPKRGVPFEKGNVKDVVYKDGRIANYAIKKLQNFKNSSQPFFLTVGFKKPHLPFNAPSKYWDLYAEKDIELPQNGQRPKGAPDASMHNFGELRAYYGIPKEGPIPDSLARKLIHGYYASVSYVDKQVGRVLNTVEDLGLDENTIIVLWGDHGWQLGEHGLWCKHANYRTSLHIPLILRVPGKQTNIRQSGLVGSVDIFPTLCDLAGLAKPFHLQGKSFAKRLDNPRIEGKEAIFARSPLEGETIITDSYSYTEFFDDEKKQIVRMLYDLQNDPQENTNVAEDPEHKALIRELSKKLHQHIEQRDRISLP